MEPFLFYLFAALLLFAAVRVVTVRNPVKAALFLVLAFFSSAALWLLLEAEFLAIVLVLVYVGAVMVLFLFVVMMLDVEIAPLREGFARYLPMGLLVTVAVAVEMALALGYRYFGLERLPPPARHAADYSNTEMLGVQLYGPYAFAVEVAAVLLLAAIVAAIALTHRRRADAKRQDVAAQQRVRREDRVRLVDLRAAPLKQATNADDAAETTQ